MLGIRRIIEGFAWDSRANAPGVSRVGCLVSFRFWLAVIGFEVMTAPLSRSLRCRAELVGLEERDDSPR